jgi:hypothetical protein
LVIIGPARALLVTGMAIHRVIHCAIPIVTHEKSPVSGDFSIYDPLARGILWGF